MKPLLYVATVWLSIVVPGQCLAEPEAKSVWLSLETDDPVAKPACVGFTTGSPTDTLRLHLVTGSIETPLQHLRIGLELTSAPQILYEGITPAPGFSATVEYQEWLMIVTLERTAACAPLASAQIVATVEFTQVGWEWIYLASNPLPSGEPPLSYADCEGEVHALDWDTCGSVDVNDPHSPVVPTSFGAIKALYR